MKRRKLILSFAVICFALVNSACSYFTQFVIINKSNAPAEIQLKYEPLSGERYLMKKSLDEKGLISDGDWQKLAAEEFTDNKPAEIVNLTLAPNTALAVANELNYTGHESDSASDFKVNGLEINGASGAVNFEGRQVILQFEKQNESLYTLVYQ